MKPHLVFTRRDNDLELQLEITLLEVTLRYTEVFFVLARIQSLNALSKIAQALVGFTSDIVHLDNRILRLERKDVVSPETVWKIPHEGMPIRKGGGGGNGDLLVRFVIKFPSEHEELDASLKEAIAMILPD